MSTLENTLSMMRTLPEADLLEIQKFTKKLLQRHENEVFGDAAGNILKPMTREEFLGDIKTAEQEIADRKYKSAEKVFDELEQRYGL